MTVIRNDEYVRMLESDYAASVRQQLAEENRAVVEAARKNGYREGLEAGRRDLRVEFGEAVSALVTFDETVETAVEETLLKLLADCLRLIEGEEPDSDRVANVVRASLKAADLGKVAEIRVCAHDEGMFRRIAADAQLPRVVVDPLLGSGEVVVVGPFGRRRLGPRNQIMALLRGITSLSGAVRG